MDKVKDENDTKWAKDEELVKLAEALAHQENISAFVSKLIDGKFLEAFEGKVIESLPQTISIDKEHTQLTMTMGTLANDGVYTPSEVYKALEQAYKENSNLVFKLPHFCPQEFPEFVNFIL